MSGKIKIVLIIFGLILVSVWLLFFGIKPADRMTNQTRSPTAQPGQSPFLSNSGKEEIILPEPSKKSYLSVEEAIFKRRSVRDYKSEPLSLKEISQIVWAAQGITDPSSGGRTAPSAGALYPLKVYVAGEIKGLEMGIYEYNPSNHSLIKIGDKDIRKKLAAAAYNQVYVEKAPVDVIFTGIYEIIAKKYGTERAPRYTHMEVGHAAQNVYLQAESLNLGTVVVGGFETEEVKKILKLPPEEEPLYIMPIGKR